MGKILVAAILSLNLGLSPAFAAAAGTNKAGNSEAGGLSNAALLLAIRQVASLSLTDAAEKLASAGLPQALTSSEISQALETIRNVEARLDYAFPNSGDNSDILRPLNAAIEKHAPSLSNDSDDSLENKQPRALLLLATHHARGQIANQVHFIHDTYVERKLGQKPNFRDALKTAYNDAALIYSYQLPYVESELIDKERRETAARELEWVRPNLEKEYSILLRVLRWEKSAAKYAAEQKEHPDAQSRIPSSDGGFIAALPDPPESKEHSISRLQNSVERDLSQQEDISSESDENVNADQLWEIFFRETDPAETEKSRYPLNTFAQDLRIMELEARSGRFVSFWGKEENLYQKFEDILETKVFAHLGRVGRLGPWARAVVKALHRQNDELYRTIQKIKPALPKASGSNLREKELKLHENLKRYIDDHVYPLIKQDAENLEQARELSQRIARSHREGLSYRLHDFIELIGLLKIRAKMALADRHDPGHWKEVRRELMDGFSNEEHADILILEKIGIYWLEALKQPRAFLPAWGIMGAAIIMLFVSTLHFLSKFSVLPSLLPGVLGFESHFFMDVIWFLVGAAGIVNMVEAAIHMLRFKHLGPELTRLSTAKAPRISAGLGRLRLRRRL